MRCDLKVKKEEKIKLSKLLNKSYKYLLWHRQLDFQHLN